MNSHANDDHWAVIAKILGSGRAPDVMDCHQCYHPKLFHWSAYYWLRLLGIDTARPGILASQIMNGIVGLMTLIVVWRFLAGLRLSAGARIAAFGLFALNPSIVTVNAQATNDTFAIFFSALAIHSTIQALRARPGCSPFVFAAASVLANASKLTALQVTLPCAVVVGLHSLARRRALALVCAVAVVSSAWYRGPLAESRERFGSAVTFNYGELSPIAENWREFRRTEQSVWAELISHYASFRFVSLMIDPELPWEGWTPLQKSLWTQVYARANSIRFAPWPAQYTSKSGLSRFIRRAIYVLALSPFSIFVIGFILETARILRWRPGQPIDYDALLMCSVVVCSLLFAILFTFVYFWPDGAHYKAIYMFPAALGYLGSYGRGLGALRPHRPLGTAALVCAGLLMLMYVADASTLALDLSRQ